VTRPDPSRAGAISTVVVVGLVVLAVVALWPGGPRPAGRWADGPVAAAVPDVELTTLRATAALAPCPTAPAPPTQASAAGALRDVTVPCLGAPGPVDLGAALAGRPALLSLWASWCAPCREELPVLAEYAAGPGAIPVLGVNVRDDPRAALRLLTDLGVTLPSVTDPDAVLAAALDVPPGLPMSYVVRADGSVTRVDPPVPFRTAAEVAAAVDRSLAS